MADAPEIIHATINGMSTSFPSGRRHLVGGWGETDDKPRAVRYVRADLYDARTSEFAMARTDADQLRMTLRQVEAERDAILAQVEAMREAFAHAPAHVDFAHMSAFTAAYDEWWEDHVEPALAKPTGSPDGQQ